MNTNQELQKQNKTDAKNPEAHVLVDASNLTLSIPTLTTPNKTLIGNPWQIIKNLYQAKSKRISNTIINDATFSLHQGQSLGLIGKNGVGKSTLLRVIAGIYEPSKGTLSVHGKAQGLFDMTLGMMPLATGIENIYLRSLQMGLGIAEIKNNIPTIIEFSELGDAINKPLQVYSAGMKLRLAVAISTMIEPDILLLDEWIGAGDKQFSQKVKNRMTRLVDNSKGLIIATHNKGLMKMLCTHGIVLENGSIQYYGAIQEALEFYDQKMEAAASYA